MTLLDSHLEQISLSSAAIAELPFPPPKIFTNAILHTDDITALIRDTESHERALFSLATAEDDTQSLATKVARRTTLHGRDGPAESFLRSRGQRSAVASLLGGDLGAQIRRQAGRDGRDRGEGDVQVLLDGAEKLCAIYPIAGSSERIASLRSRHQTLCSSIAHYEAREAKQMSQLSKMKRQKSEGGDYEMSDNEDSDDIREAINVSGDTFATEADLRKEEQEICLLEEKKNALEERVSGMEKDLGGLLR